MPRRYTADQYLNAARGEQLPQAKLTEALVREIRANREGLTAREQAARHGVTVRAIEAVRSYQNWRHVA